MLESIYNQSINLLNNSGFAYSDKEALSMEISDFGLGRPLEEGAQMITLESTSRMAIKLIILLPFQILPEHWHVDNGDIQAKQELIRVISGHLDLYINGSPEEAVLPVPELSLPYYTCKKKVVLKESEQMLIDPPNPHWLKAGNKGCVALSFSTTAFDTKDVFRNPDIKR